MFSVDDRQVRLMAERLGKIPLSIAQKNTLNKQARITQINAKLHVQKNMLIRNTWTVRSIRVDYAKDRHGFAITGSTERYMMHQEFGYTDHKHTSMATPFAGGESNRAKVRTRQVRKANRLANIKIRKTGTRSAGNQLQQNMATLREAKANGDKFVYLQYGRKRGIYKVFGTKRKPKARKVQDLTRKVAVIPKNPWLEPSRVSEQETKDIFFAEMRKQVNRTMRY